MVDKSTSTPKRKSVKLTFEDWQWLVNERAATGKAHGQIIHDFITNEHNRRAIRNLLSDSDERRAAGERGEAG